MANEATLLVELEPPVNFTCANATAITKGTLMKLTDPMTAIISTASNDPICGIAAADKIVSDGNTHIAVYMRGIFKVSGSGTITAGDALMASDTANYPNYVQKSGLTSSGMRTLGYALETSTNGQTLKILLNVGVGGFAS